MWTQHCSVGICTVQWVQVKAGVQTDILFNLLSVVLQCKLVSGWGLRKNRSAPFYWSGRTVVFTCENSYCLQRILAIAILSVCPSSHGWISQRRCQKDLARITESTPSAAWKTLVSGTVKLFHKFERGHPERRCEMRLGWKDFQFLANKTLYLNNGARYGRGYY